jgi:hypothetical protein
MISCLAGTNSDQSLFDATGWDARSAGVGKSITREANRVYFED